MPWFADSVKAVFIQLDDSKFAATRTNQKTWGIFTILYYFNLSLIHLLVSNTFLSLSCSTLDNQINPLSPRATANDDAHFMPGLLRYQRAEEIRNYAWYSLTLENINI